jgi:hypothetical protein
MRLRVYRTPNIDRIAKEGNRYRLNAEEDPEDFNYPRDPRFKALLGPRAEPWPLDSKVSEPIAPSQLT